MTFDLPRGVSDLKWNTARGFSPLLLECTPHISALSAYRISTFRPAHASVLFHGWEGWWLFVFPALSPGHDATIGFANTTLERRIRAPDDACCVKPLWLLRLVTRRRLICLKSTEVCTCVRAVWCNGRCMMRQKNNAEMRNRLVRQSRVWTFPRIACEKGFKRIPNTRKTKRTSGDIRRSCVLHRGRGLVSLGTPHREL